MQLGSQHVVIVHSDDGLDEASIAAPSRIYDFKPGYYKQFTIQPKQTYPLAEIQVASIEDSAALIQNPNAAAQAAIELNLKLALYAANIYDHVK